MKLRDIIRYIAALQDEGCTVESIKVSPPDAETMQHELEASPTSLDAVNNQIALRLFEAEPRFFLMGHPVFVDELLKPGSLSIQWWE